MKTLLAIMLLVVSVSLCRAEETKKTEYAVSVDTSKINLGQQVDQMAEALKKHLDGPLGIYYQAAVRRNRAMGLVGVLGFVICFLGAAVLGKVACWAHRQNEYMSHAEAMAFSIVGAIALMVTGLIGLFLNMEKLVAPEYVALNDILLKIGAIVH